MNKLSTNEIIKLVTKNKNNVYEISLNNGIFNATHFLSYGGKKIYDTGIDSKVTKWFPNEFISFYPRAFWIIDQII